MGSVISNLLWLGALLGVVVGTFFWIGSVLSAQSAPQQGAMAAMGAAAAILPYVAARAVDAMRRNESPTERGAEPVAPVPTLVPEPARVYTAEEIQTIRARGRIALTVAGVAAAIAVGLAVWARELTPGTAVGQYDVVASIQATIATFAVIGFAAGVYGAAKISDVWRR